MRGRIFKLLGVAALAALATVLALTMTAGAKDGQRAKGKHALSTGLSGAEVSGGGDPDGRGRTKVRLLPRFGAVCFILRTRDIEAPTGAHIHRGARGETGPHAVDLFPPGDARDRGCVDGVERDLLRELARHPERFYVNLHNHEFVDGAIRGQLSKSRGHGRRRGR